MQTQQTAPAPASPATGTPPQANGKVPNHPVLDILNVLPVHAQLAVTLATLAPQGMNYEGIEECLKQPRLTQAWLDYVLAQGDEIRSPAAYIRQGVRSAKPPIARAQTVASPATPNGSTRKRGAFERMDPNEYTLWPFDAGEWRKIDPSLSDEAFAAWVETYDPETVRPKFVQ